MIGLVVAALQLLLQAAYLGISVQSLCHDQDINASEEAQTEEMNMVRIETWQHNKTERDLFLE